MKVYCLLLIIPNSNIFYKLLSYLMIIIIKINLQKSYYIMFNVIKV